MSQPVSLRILITNLGLANRTGTEIVTLDLAAGLARAGHFPMIWVPLLEPAVAAPAMAAGIPVVSDLDDLPYSPDVIHGHHHLETLVAVRRFPDVPAIFVCHSGYWWHDAPPRHPSIRRYVAVDEFCRERLLNTPWIDRQQIHVILNAVDLSRHPPRPALPDRPRQALIFSNNAGLDTHSEPIGAACLQAGIDLHTVGSGVGNLSLEPGRLLPQYDLVFAKARCAIEAMATGCAVILCDTTGLGPLVTSANVLALRRWNFGFRILQRPLATELIAHEIRRYDPQDATKVSTFIRDDATLEHAVRQYLEVYRKVLGAPPSAVDGVDWHPPSVPLQIEDQANMRLRLVRVPDTALVRQHFNLKVGLHNGTAIPVVTAAPWPCLLMYRWLEARSGEVAVEHGFRTIIQPPAWPGTETIYDMRVIAPSKPGEYVLRVTIIQEGWRWLDMLEPYVCATARVRVGAV